MSEWWTYQLSDLILFSPQTYFRLIELYNNSIWPAQILALILGCTIAALAWRRPNWNGRVISVILAVCWLWVAWAFHLQRFADIHWVATYFAAGFVIQAILIVWVGVVKDRLAINPIDSAIQILGLSIFIFALFVQPLLTAFIGNNWGQAELFAITPDPTVTGTIGVLLLTNINKHWWLIIIPIVWCIVSAATLWVLESMNFIVLVVTGFLALFAILKMPKYSDPSAHR